MTPTLARPFRQNLIDGWGSGIYRAIFSIVVVVSIALMVYGWRNTPQVTLYQLPECIEPIGFILMMIAFKLFGSSHHETVIMRFTRLPQLVSIIIWAYANN